MKWSRATQGLYGDRRDSEPDAFVDDQPFWLSESVDGDWYWLTVEVSGAMIQSVVSVALTEERAWDNLHDTYDDYSEVTS